MNAITFDTAAQATIDAKDSLSPIPIIKLKGALKKEAEHTVVAIETTDPHVERDLRDFCTASGHLYLGVIPVGGYDVHYVKKQIRVCETCNHTRIVLAGVAAAGALAYTTPQVATGDPSAPITFLFLMALAALPPLLVNNARLLGALIRKTTKA